MIWRAAWSGLLLVIALVAVGAQLDRSSRFASELAPYVPAPFRGFAQQKLTEMAILSEDGPVARAHGVHLVKVRPIAAENLTLLAQASALAGDNDMALRALEAAGARGWREPGSQQAAAESALAVGNSEAAAQRITALLATGMLADDVMRDLVSRLTQSPQGREALAQRIAAGGRWQRQFVATSSGYLGPQEYADLMARALRLGADLPCDALRRAAGRFDQDGNAVLAEQFWPGNC